MGAAWQVVLISAVAQPRPDPALLRPVVNQVSNCSFEAADAAGRPLGWSLAEDYQSVVVSKQQPLHGRYCLVISSAQGAAGDAGKPVVAVEPTEGPVQAARQVEPPAEAVGPTEASEEGEAVATPAVWQSVAVEGGTKYVLCAWVRSTTYPVGTPIVAVDCRDEAGQAVGRQEAIWTGAAGQWVAVVLPFSAPPGAHRAVMQFIAPPAGAEVAVDAVSLTRADGKPPRRPEAPAISNPRVAFIQPMWALLAWDGTADAYVVEWRRASKRFSWQRAPGVTEKFYSVVDLAADTSYQARVCAAAAPFYDEHGQAVTISSPPRWHVLSFRTPKAEPRRWAGFRVWPAYRLETFSSGVTASALEAVGDRLYVVEAREGALYLSRVVPETRQVEWTKVVVEALPDADVAAPDVCALSERLWIAWDSVSRSGATPQAVRRCLTFWDLTTGLRGEVHVLRPATPAGSVQGGSVAAFRGGLWLTWSEEPAGDRASRIVVAPFDPQTGQGASTIWDDCPAVHPKDPCLVPTDGDLGLAYTDLPRGHGEGGHVPLLWASFARQRFMGLRALLSFGRASRPRGLRIGSFVLLAYESKTRLDRLANRFTDVWLMRLGPGPGDITTFPYAYDYKHNASPDLALCRGDVYVAYTKLEREPEGHGQLAGSYGTYLGRIEPEVKVSP
ncbi:MAG: fibronectin type III domain-containing protein [Armatimonadetes bacterium]|nr:fibronectin type III domain-containing protein [Armatimonadota bacterium]